MNNEIIVPETKRTKNEAVKESMMQQLLTGKIFNQLVYEEKT